MQRSDGRKSSESRSIQITPNVSEYAEGSALIEFGKTRVLCTASYEDQVPKWLQGTGSGWVTAEYGMLPRSTHSRMKRERIAEGGRTHEISRLIGRSIRAAVDLRALGEKQLTIDCDVINADGGTRTAAVSGGFVALALALQKLQHVGELTHNPLKYYLAAISVGVHADTNKKQFLVDLNYDEDSSIGADVNFVLNNQRQFIEVQGTGESALFSSEDLMAMMDLAQQACEKIFTAQEKVIGTYFPRTNG